MPKIAHAPRPAKALKRSTRLGKVKTRLDLISLHNPRRSPQSQSNAIKSSAPPIRPKSRPLFWFQRAANPEYFDLACAFFQQAQYKPEYIQEPPEHDVLLSRIANGEGMALLPESFAKIRREGIKFLLPRVCQLKLGLGLVWKKAEPESLLKTINGWAARMS